MKNGKIVTLVALAVAIVALGVGLAAFTSTLTITSTANVTPNSGDFKVGFSTATDSITAGSVEPNGGSSSTGYPAATLTGTSFSVSGISFDAPGDSVAYGFYTVNAGQYVGYLDSFVMGKASGGNGVVYCKASSGSSANSVLVAAACESIVVRLTFGNGAATHIWSGSYNGNSATNAVVNDAFSYKYNAGATIATKNLAMGADDADLEVGEYMPVTIEITYKDGTDTVRADGAFDVTIGDITFNYSTANE